MSEKSGAERQAVAEAMGDAIAQGRLEDLLRIVGEGASLSDSIMLPGELPPPKREKIRPLVAAARAGRTEMVKALLEAGADPNEQEECCGKYSALHMAAHFGHRECVAEMLEAGAKIEAEDAQGQTPLMMAAGAAMRGRAGREDVVADLLEAGADASAFDGAGGGGAEGGAGGEKFGVIGSREQVVVLAQEMVGAEQEGVGAGGAGAPEALGRLGHGGSFCAESAADGSGNYPGGWEGAQGSGLRGAGKKGKMGKARRGGGRREIWSGG